MSSFKREDLKTLANFSPLSPEVQGHLQKVYASLFVGMLLASLGAYVQIFLLPLGGFLSAIASMAFLALCLNSSGHSQKFFFGAFTLFQGVSIGPLVSLALSIDPSIVFTALSGSVVVFACFSLSALFSTKRSYLYLGGLLSSAISLMLWLSFINIFMRSTSIFNFQLYFGLLVFCGYVLFDTQLIVEKANLGNTNYIADAATLFVDLVGLVVRILIILSDNSEKKKKKSNS